MSRVRSGLSALALMVLVAVSLPAEVGGTVLEVNPYPLPWAEDPSKGLADNPIIVKVIFVAFGTSPNSDPQHAAVRENMLMRCKTSFLQQSNERHNIEFEILPVPGQPGAMWTLLPQGQGDFQNSGDFRFPYAFDRFSASWAYGSAQGEFQARVMELIQLTYDAEFGIGGWTSPLANADAVLFAVAPDLGGRAEYPLAMNDGQLGAPYLRLKVTTNQPEIARVTNAAPSIGPDDAMLGAIVMLDPAGLGDSTRNVAAIIHYWCRILGLWDIQSVRGTLAFPNHFGAYSVARPWLSESAADYPSRAPIIDHPSRVKLNWIDPIEIAANLRDVHLTSATSGGQIYRMPVSHTTADIPLAPFQLACTAVADEYFLVAYEDGTAAEYGGSDTGLFIWHCVEYTP